MRKGDKEREGREGEEGGINRPEVPPTRVSEKYATNFSAVRRTGAGLRPVGPMFIRPGISRTGRMTCYGLLHNN